jgi:hypothetical protein
MASGHGPNEVTGRSLVLLTLSGAGYSQHPATPALSPQAANTIVPPESGAVPKWTDCPRRSSGDWDTVETMERSDLFPNGGSRRGLVHAKLVAGGTTLLYEVHSNGSSGKLDVFLAIWWDKSAKLYQLFVCFNNPNRSCKMRGTAYWKGDTFVNNYEEVVQRPKDPMAGHLYVHPDIPHSGCRDGHGQRFQEDFYYNESTRR